MCQLFGESFLSRLKDFFNSAFLLEIFLPNLPLTEATATTGPRIPRDTDHCSEAVLSLRSSSNALVCLRIGRLSPVFRLRDRSILVDFPATFLRGKWYRFSLDRLGLLAYEKYMHCNVATDSILALLALQ